MPVDDASADTVVITWTLCTVPETAAALAETRRVLKPSGRLIFVEHGRAEDDTVRRQQDFMNPVWRRLAGGCNLNRPIDEIIAAADFRFDELTANYLSLPRTLDRLEAEFPVLQTIGWLGCPMVLMNSIGVLLPMALCGRSSLYSLR